jgi:transcriptional regulator with XRE-family HTH domain
MTSKALRSALERLGWQQREMARYLGVSDGAVSMWLNNHRPVPGPVAVAVNAALKSAQTEAVESGR